MPKKIEVLRRCKRPECGRLLSRYNPGDECLSHNVSDGQAEAALNLGLREPSGRQTSKHSTKASKD